MQDRPGLLSEEEFRYAKWHMIERQLERFFDDFLNPHSKKLIPGFGKHTGMLLYGPPGNGKTRFIDRFFETGLGRIIFKGSAASLFEGVVGETSKKIAKMFADARKTPHVPCFIFMDELESIAQDRTRNQSQQQYKSDFLNTLLGEMDPAQNPNLLIFAATNFKDPIDEAFLRFGRVNFLMLLPELNADGRRAFLKCKLPLVKQEYRKTLEEIVLCCI
ncbi:Cell division control protein 48 C [Phlyctochytrium bullatum]|nr:Cell division control protein 48 C [Phlyctochytrium bullatum]